MEAGQEIAIQEQAPNAALSAPLIIAVRRAVDAVRDETLALRADPTADLKRFEYAKSQALLDLTRARSAVPPAAFSPELKSGLEEFKEVLNENAGLLTLHMNAVSEVVEMMSRTMIDFDSDGTYQAPFPEPAR
ncbi:hypothetical protein [Labrenzia sp. 011]|uniref:hypothetical protein n=1 Tax=Labrenzia sp. 011 TaxID=2171494 RepID=UPI000D5077BA|nr:hypothetical protein [Labrenzia sp. 011]PVB62698.1 hypothetical protein DCO57_05460 [Labrenzia sp. 011]